jgi:hypothetical protein
MSQFNTNVGSYISKSLAKQYGDTYKNGSRFQPSNNSIAHFFGATKISEILNQEGCIGIRAYYGSKVSPSNKEIPELILVGVDSYGNDIMTNGLILDASLPCPNLCAQQGHSIMD